MDRLFLMRRSMRVLAGAVFAAWLAFLPFSAHESAEPVFFSLLFPQLMPGFAEEFPAVMTPGEAVAL